MIRISALGSDDSDNESESASTFRSQTVTKEAQEAELYSVYNKALESVRQGDTQLAIQQFTRLLDHQLIKQLEASEDSVDPRSSTQLLRYSACKNLAGLHQQTDQHDRALQLYIRAAEIDGSDVTVWCKMGRLALLQHNYPLARYAFLEGLACNERHWPCLENIITLMYALCNYHGCLQYIAQALERDPGYVRGLAFMQRIYTEQPYLQKDTMHLFHECDASIYDTAIEDDEAEEYMAEALAIRAKKQELGRGPQLPLAKFSKPLRHYRWEELGECLLALYEHMHAAVNSSTCDRTVSIFGCKVDLSPYLDLHPPDTMDTSRAATDAPAIQVIPPEDPPYSALPPLTVTTNQIATTPSNQPISSLLAMASPAYNVSVATQSLLSVTPSPIVHSGTPFNTPLSTPLLSSLSPGTVPTPSLATPLSSEPATPQGGSSLASTPAASLESDVTGLSGSVDPDVIDILNVEDPELKGSYVMPFDHGYASGPLGRAGVKRKKPKKDDDMLYGGKRRSSRVRNVVRKKEEEVINYQDLLTKFLPSSLIYGRPDGDKDIAMEIEDTMDSAPATQATSEAPRVVPGHQRALSDAGESEKVREFVTRFQHNSGVIELLGEWCMAVAADSLLKWPAELGPLFMQCYDRTRRHMTYPDYLCKDYPDWRIASMATMCLVYTELKVDSWMARRASVLSTPTQSPRRSPQAKLKALLGNDYLGPEFNDDVDYLVGLSCLQDLLGESGAQFAARLFWVRAKLTLLENDMEVALDSYYTVLDYLSSGSAPDSETGSDVTIHLPNNQCESLITKEHVEREISSLERCQSLEEVHRLHEAREYDRVVSLLIDTFRQARPVVELVERHEQLLLLQDSLERLGRYARCLLWSEVSLHEAWRRYQRAGSRAARQDWCGTMVSLMHGIERCLAKEKSSIDKLPSKNLLRLCQNAISILDTCLEAADSSADPPVSSHLPWIILYRLIAHEERRLKVATDDLPASVMLLNFAHEYLGRRSLCTGSEGKLLLFTITEFMSELASGCHDNDSPHPLKEDLEIAIGQCFYCLYGYPHKRTKAKHLQDHNANQLTLEWERAVQVFEYFKPKTMPEFDSVRTSTVSAELENLLKRIVLLIPQDNYSGNTVESVSAYIEGAITQQPALPEGKLINVPVVKEIYYLLADYYFKNKEQGKAVKFYIQDLCLNPTRFDSWAGMALARSSRLEQRLNSHELKNDPGTVQKQAHAALRCFVRALSIDNTNAKLWIEYGSLAYQLHAYLSRTLKQASMFPLSDEVLQLTRRNKAEMLRVAHDSYRRAGACEYGLDEPWLQHYMLGKLCEKLRQPPPTYLHHYKMAAQCLHEERARYPKKITYILSPPFLSVEALEVFYRMHVCTLKYLLRNEALILEMCSKTSSNTSSTKASLSANTSPINTSASENASPTKASENISPIKASAASNTSPIEASLNTSPTKASSNTTPTEIDGPASQKTSGNISMESAPEDDFAKPTSSKAIATEENKALEKSSKSNEEGRNESEKTSKTAGDTELIQEPNAEKKSDTGDDISKLGDNKEAKETGDAQKESEDKARGFYLDVFAEYIDGSMKAPFALGQEKEKPKLKIADRSETANTTGTTTVKTPTRASRLDHTYSNCSSGLVPAGPAPAFPPSGASSQDSSMDTSVFTSPTVTSPNPVTSPTLLTSPQYFARSIATSSITALGAMSVSTPVLTAPSVPSSTQQVTVLQPQSTLIEQPASTTSIQKTHSSGPPHVVETTSVPQSDSTEPSRPDMIRAGSFGFKPTEGKVDILVEAIKPATKDADEIKQKEQSRKPRLSFSMETILDLPSSKVDTPTKDPDAIETNVAPKEKGLKIELRESLVPEDLVLVSDVQEETEKKGEIIQRSTSETDTPVGTSLDKPVNVLDGKIEQTTATTTAANTSLTTAADITSSLSITSNQLNSTLAESFDTCVSRDATLNDAANDTLTSKDVTLSKSVAKDTSTDQPVAMDTSREFEVEIAALEAIENLSRALQSHSSEGSHDQSRDSAPDQSLPEASNDKLLDESHGQQESTQGFQPSQSGDHSNAALNVGLKRSASDAGLDQSADDDHKLPKQADQDSKEDKDTDPCKPELKDEKIETEDMKTDTAGDELDSLAAFISKLDQSMHEVSDSDDDEKETEGDANNETDKQTKKEEPIADGDQPMQMAETDNSSFAPKETENIEGKSGNQTTEATVIKIDPEISSGNQLREDKKDETIEASQISDSDKKADEANKVNKEKAKSSEADESKSESASDDKKRDLREMYESVVRKCIDALGLCLGRFPQHYKSLYRLGYLYSNSEVFKNMPAARDVLLGNKERGWQELTHMPCPGLFQERKNANFFQGLWRIPVEDIDRSGSFATHMTKAVSLAFDVLQEVMDHKTLYHIHVQLSRTPEQGKKYLRDAERVLLARQAYEYCFDVITDWLPIIRLTDDMEERHKFLLDVHRFWQHGVRHQISVKRINAIFTDVYHACKAKTVEGGATTCLEQAMKYCQQLSQLRAAQLAAAKASVDPASQLSSQETSSVQQAAKPGPTPGQDANPIQGPAVGPGATSMQAADQLSLPSPAVASGMDPVMLTQAVLSSLAAASSSHSAFKPGTSPQTAQKSPGSKDGEVARSGVGGLSPPYALGARPLPTRGASLSPPSITMSPPAGLSPPSLAFSAPAAGMSSLASKTAQIRNILGNAMTSSSIQRMTLPPAVSRVTTSQKSATSHGVTSSNLTSEAQVQHALKSVLAKKATTVKTTAQSSDFPLATSTPVYAQKAASGTALKSGISTKVVSKPGITQPQLGQQKVSATMSQKPQTSLAKQDAHMPQKFKATAPANTSQGAYERFLLDMMKSPTASPTTPARHPVSQSKVSTQSLSQAQVYSRSASQQQLRPTSDSQSQSRTPPVSQSQSRTPSVGQSLLRKPSVSQSQSRMPSVSQSRMPSASQSQSRMPSVSQSQLRMPSVSQSQLRMPSGSQSQSRKPSVSQSLLHAPTGKGIQRSAPMSTSKVGLVPASSARYEESSDSDVIILSSSSDDSDIDEIVY